MTDKKFGPNFTRRGFMLSGAMAGGAGLMWSPAALAAGFVSEAGGLAGHTGHGGCLVCQSMSGATTPELGIGHSLRTASGSLLAAGSSGAGQKAKAFDTQGNRGITIIQPDWVLACKNDELKLLQNHEVVIEGDKIQEIRPWSKSRDKRLMAAGQILLPSFISGHTHSNAGTLTRGFIEETSYSTIVGESHTPRARSLLVPMTMIDNLTDDEIDDLTALNLAEMLRTGCTTQIEMSLSLRSMQSYVRVATRFGMRGFPGSQVPDMSRVLPIWTRKNQQVLLDSEADTLKEIQANLDYARTVNGSADGRIRPMMTPSTAAVMTRETFAAISRAAAELGNGVHIHIQNGWRPRDRAELLEYWGKREVEVLQEVGLLDHRCFGAHMLGLDLVNDLPILAKAKEFTFSHCPQGAGAGVLPSSQPYPEALAAGINTCIGLDTHSNDFIENIKLAEMQGRGRAQLLSKTSPVPLVEPTIWHVMRSATLGAAKGLGRDDLGRIQAGAKADICTVAIDGLLVGSGTPALEPLNNLLYANGLAVRHVMTDGTLQVRDGKLLVGDEAELIKRGGAAVNKIWSQLKQMGYFDRTANTR